MAQECKNELDKAQEEALESPGWPSESESENTMVALVRGAGFGVVDTGCGRGLVGEATLKKHEELLKQYSMGIKDMDQVQGKHFFHHVDKSHGSNAAG